MQNTNINTHSLQYQSQMDFQQHFYRQFSPSKHYVQNLQPNYAGFDTRFSHFNQNVFQHSKELPHCDFPCFNPQKWPDSHFLSQKDWLHQRNSAKSHFSILVKSWIESQRDRFQELKVVLFKSRLSRCCFEFGCRQLNGMWLLKSKKEDCDGLSQVGWRCTLQGGFSAHNWWRMWGSRMSRQSKSELSYRSYSQQ